MDPFDIDIDSTLSKKWWELGISPLGSVSTESIEDDNQFNGNEIVHVSDCHSYDDISICPLPWYPRNDLLDDMNKFYVHEQGSEWKIPSTKYCHVGQLLAATWETFGYHRVYVKAILSERRVHIVYLDWGTEEEVFSVDQLRLLHKKFLSLPVQAVPAKVSSLIG